MIGQYTVTISAKDSHGGNATTDFLWIVTNPVPEAIKDRYTVTEDTVLTVESNNGVIVNDLDLDKDELRAILVNLPNHGAVTFAADGTFIYIPDPDYTGSDTFTYRLSDGLAESSDAQVRITNLPVNDAPVAIDDNYLMNEDTVLIVLPANGVLINDLDVDGGTFDLSSIVLSDTPNGSLILKLNGTFTYVPDPGFSGEDVFTYFLSDGITDSNVAEVTIHVDEVNDEPQSEEFLSLISMDGESVLIEIGSRFIDEDGDGLSFSAVGLPGGLEIDPGTGVVSGKIYTQASEIGVYLVTVTADDGRGGKGTVNFEWLVKNPVPVATDDPYSIVEDSVLTVGQIPGVLLNDSDEDGDELEVGQLSDPLNGILILENDGSFTYTANPNFNGDDQFTYRINDGKNDSGVATVNIRVVPENDVPVPVNDHYTMNEDAVLIIVSEIGVLLNDRDVEGQRLTALIIDDPANGDVILGEDGSFRYIPQLDFNGLDEYTYRVSDGESESGPATVTISVNPVDEIPAAVDDDYAMQEDSVLSVTVEVGLLVNDIREVGGILTALEVSDVGRGELILQGNGTFVYSPEKDFVGVDRFTYKVTDGNRDSGPATVTIIVIGENDVPVVENDHYIMVEDSVLSVNVEEGAQANDHDADGDELIAKIQTMPGNGNIIFGDDGSFFYLPRQNFFGQDSYTYRVDDGKAESEIATVIITINPVNDTPIASDDNYVMIEDSVLRVDTEIGVLKNDMDPDGDELNLLVVQDLLFGIMVLNDDGSFNYTPGRHFNGIDSFTYRVSDGNAESEIATVTIRVIAENDVPVAVDDSYKTNEDVVLIIGIEQGILTNDMDSDRDDLTVAVVDSTEMGNLVMKDNGEFMYLPFNNFAGVDGFTYQANDGANDSNIAKVRILVNPVNDSPVITQIADREDDDGQIVEMDVFTHLEDIDGDLLVFQSEGLPPGLSIDPVTGVISGAIEIDSSIVGDYLVTIHVNDGNGGATSITFIWFVNNPVPVAQTDSYTVDEDTVLKVHKENGVLINDDDPDGDVLVVEIVNGPTNGSVNLQPDGSFDYRPLENFDGVDTFTYRVDDGLSTSEDTTVKIKVNPVNDFIIAIGDNYSVDQDTFLIVGVEQGVLLNDLDPDGDAIEVILTKSVDNGILNILADGTFEYQPNPGFFGEDQFTYRVTDGQISSAEVLVNIQVKTGPVNTLPHPRLQRLLTNSELIFSSQNDPPNLFSVFDPDSSELTVIMEVEKGAIQIEPHPELDFPEGELAGKRIVLFGKQDDINEALDGLVYRPIEDYFGSDSLRITSLDEDNRFDADNDAIDLIVELPSLGGIPAFSLDHLKNPVGLTLTGVEVVSFDDQLINEVRINPETLTVEVLPIGGQNGEIENTMVEILVTYDDGTTVLVPVPMVIYQPLLTSVENDYYDNTFSVPVFNPQSSLFEQKVRVVNNSPFDFESLRITVIEYPENLVLWNSGGTDERGRPYIEYYFTIPSGSSQELNLEYFNPDRQPFIPELKLELFETQKPELPETTGNAVEIYGGLQGYSPTGNPKFYLSFPKRLQPLLKVPGRLSYGWMMVRPTPRRFQATVAFTKSFLRRLQLRIYRIKKRTSSEIQFNSNKFSGESFGSERTASGNQKSLASPIGSPGASMVQCKCPVQRQTFTFRIYDNGFNRVDSTGNLVSPPPPGKYSINRTSFFGYQDSSQVVNDTDFTDSELIDPHGGTLSLHSAAISGGEYEDDVENDVVPGIELFYRYEWIEKENWTLDWEASFSYQFFNWDEGGTHSEV